jgi:hypothetical protein
MKKVIILIGILSAFAIKAETYIRTPAYEISGAENMYAGFNIKTSKFDKVFLDCQSLVHSMNFYIDKKIVHKTKMVDYNSCDNISNFIYQSLEKDKSVCIEIEVESKSINLSNDEASDCQ